MSEHAEPLALFDAEPARLADVVDLAAHRTRAADEDARIALVLHTLGARNELRRIVGRLLAVQLDGRVDVDRPLAVARQLLGELEDIATAAAIVADEPLALIGNPAESGPLEPRQLIALSATTGGMRAGNLPPARPCNATRADGRPCRAYALPWNPRPLCRAHASDDERAVNAVERAAWNAAREAGR